MVDGYKKNELKKRTNRCSVLWDLLKDRTEILTVPVTLSRDTQPRVTDGTVEITGDIIN